MWRSGLSREPHKLKNAGSNPAIRYKIKYMRGDRCPRSLINFLFCGQFTASLLKIKRLKIEIMRYYMNICESYRNINKINDDENIVPLDW